MKCWKYLVKYKFREAALAPFTVFTSTWGGYLLKHSYFDWAEKMLGPDRLSIATGRRYLHLSPALMALPGRPG